MLWNKVIESTWPWGNEKKFYKVRGMFQNFGHYTQVAKVRISTKIYLVKIKKIN